MGSLIVWLAMPIHLCLAQKNLTPGFQRGSTPVSKVKTYVWSLKGNYGICWTVLHEWQFNHETKAGVFGKLNNMLLNCYYFLQGVFGWGC